MADIPQLYRLANQLRQDCIRMTLAAGSGHLAGPLGLAEVMAVLYGAVLRVDPARPLWDERDLLVMSNGHYAPLLYAALARRGFFDCSELSELRRFGSRLQGHPERQSLPGIETTSGPLGSGLSQAVGMAYHARQPQPQPQPQRTVYCLLGDGELAEGNVWEAVLCAHKYHLGNLIAIIDRNRMQIGGDTETVLPLEEVGAKWQSFGWQVQQIDGHDIPAILQAIKRAKDDTQRPSVIIAQTVPGKGVSFMEREYRWHGKAPNREQAAQALAELQQSEYKKESV